MEHPTKQTKTPPQSPPNKQTTPSPNPNNKKQPTKPNKQSNPPPTLCHPSSASPKISPKPHKKKNCLVWTHRKYKKLPIPSKFLHYLCPHTEFEYRIINQIVTPMNTELADHINLKKSLYNDDNRKTIHYKSSQKITCHSLASIVLSGIHVSLKYLYFLNDWCNRKQQKGTALFAGEGGAPGSHKSRSGRLLSRESSFSAQECLRDQAF